MLWEAYQHMQIADVARTAETAESKVERCTKTVADLQRHVERLSLACQAMWELLREVSDLTEQDIDKKILEIDSRDGTADGKIGLQQFDCPSCGRKTNSKRESCVICGAPIKRAYPFS